MLGKLLKELYAGIPTRYFLFLEGSRCFLALVNSNSAKGTKPKIIDLGAWNSEGEFEESKEILQKTGYGGEDITVLLAGPLVFQKISLLGNSSDTYEDLLLRDKTALWPKGIPDDELLFDYVPLENDGGTKAIYTAFIKKKTIENIEIYSRQIGLKVTNISTLFGTYFISDYSQNPEILINGTEIVGLTIREELTNSEEQIKSVVYFPLDGDGGNTPCAKLEDDAKVVKVSGEDLIGSLNSKHYGESKLIDFGGTGASKAANFFLLALKLFRPLVKLLLIFSAILVFANIYLSIKESSMGEGLLIYKSKAESIEHLKSEVNLLQGKANYINDILGGKTHLAAYLAQIGQKNPEKAWLRHLTLSVNKGSGNKLSLAGLASGEEAGLELFRFLSESKLFTNARLKDLSKVAEKSDYGVPPEYEDNLFKFSIEMESSQ
jgi:Tfp pilus assembly protein PilN